jgi:hypothetical protein
MEHFIFLIDEKKQLGEKIKSQFSLDGMTQQ